MQCDRDHRRATAALWKPSPTHEREGAGHYSRRAVTGWFPTSTRGELLAAIDVLDKAPMDSVFTGDCRYIIEHLQCRIPWRARSSHSVDADLWRTAKRAMDTKKGRFMLVKIKAHRSRIAAENEGEDSLRRWGGHHKADELARNHCRNLQAEVDMIGTRLREQHGNVLQQMAMAAGWSLRHWPEMAGKRKPREARRRAPETSPNGWIGPHSVRPRRTGGLECSKCKLRASTPSSIKTLRIKPCLGETMMQCHKTHQMRWSAGVAWCCTCGRFTSRIPHSLREPCPRRPLSGGGKNILKRLRRGLPPTTAAYLRKVAEEDSWGKEGTTTEQQPLRAQLGETGEGHQTPPTGTPPKDAGQNDAHPNLPEGNGVSYQRDGASYSWTNAASTVLASPVGNADAQTSPSSVQAHSIPRVDEAQVPAEHPARLTSLGLGGGLRPRPRSRLTGKQRPPGGVEEQACQSSPAFHCGSPNEAVAWSRRISIVKLPVPSRCCACSSHTRTMCASCQSPLCLFCAKSRRPCQ